MIVVTGGAGFIGSALVAALNKRGRTDILVVDHLADGQNWTNLRNLQFADYLEKDAFLEAINSNAADIKDVEAVLHMGACSDTTCVDASYLVANNYQYSKALALWACSKGARLLHASSAATYGDGAAGFADDHEKLATLRPLNMYGYSKHLFDLWAQRRGLLDRIVCLKYFNVFGPNEYHKGQMRSFVLKAFEQINQFGKIRLFKSHRTDFEHGMQLRDFIYVKDAVAMTLWFLDRPQACGIYNIGTGTARTWNDLIAAVFAAMDRPPEIDYIDMPESIRNQYQYFTQADMSKLRRTGFDASTTSLENAVEDYVRNYLVPGRYLG